MNLPQVEAGSGRHRKTWTAEEIEAQAFDYRVAGGFPMPTGRRRTSPYEHFTAVRSTK